MELTLNRINKGSDSTIGALYKGSGLSMYFHSFTCEDEHRISKVMNETRIPAGRYAIKLRTEGGFHKRYGKKFGNAHHGMLHLQNVPGFTYIYIHIGNSDDDTSGCILVGHNAYSDVDRGGGTIGRSTTAYIDLYKSISDCLLQGDEVHITIKDEPF